MSYNDIMATKKQCDRCESIGDAAVDIDNRWATVERPGFYDGAVLIRRYDLCPTCSNEFVKWMKATRT